MSSAKAANFAMLRRAQRHLYYRDGISTCEQGKQSQQALSLLCATWEAKLKPDVISCSAGINARGKGDQWQRSGKCGRRNWSSPSSTSKLRLGLGRGSARGGTQS
ncbi:unnamed protein product [Prorocentrum cordatum]|uniref:Histone deacetylase n=1 Tax=Prorocentrum cordatum TaxID=2364126 RepID=A0ABN9SYR6_9DINO|nr:unnamed protein product [Polarella glacialis]